MSITGEISELDGGLRVGTTPVPTAQSVSVNVFGGGGSRRPRTPPAGGAGGRRGEPLFGAQPMGWSIAGTEDTVAGLRRSDFVSWLDNWYGASNIVLSVAGNTTPDDVVKLARALFANGRRPRAPSGPPA